MVNICIICGRIPGTFGSFITLCVFAMEGLIFDLNIFTHSLGVLISYHSLSYRWSVLKKMNVGLMKCFISHNHISKCPCSLMFSSYFYPKQHVLVTTQKRKQNFPACPQLAKLETSRSGALKLAPQRKCGHPVVVYICRCLACNWHFIKTLKMLSF